MADDRPNIILFTTDQHRGDYLGLAGHPVVETPNLDSWIGQGAYFPNAYSEIPSTTGARKILHTGRGNYACGMVGYGGTEFHDRNTLAQVLADAGYHCINVGWRNMHPRRKLYGFHLVVPHDLRIEDDEYWQWLVRELGPRAHERGHGIDANGWMARPWHLEERYHPTVWTTDVALEQIQKRDPTRPFFIWISHLRPHSPYDPPQYFWDMYINRDLPKVPIGKWAKKWDIPNPGLSRTTWHGRLTPEQDQRGRAGYMGCVTQIDYELGRLMEMLQRSTGTVENTVWLFTSDHGDMLGDHNLHRKCYAYEGSARIPFVIRYPKGFDLPCGTFESPVGLQDVMPTLLDAVGVDIPGTVTGRSVLNAIRGRKWREFMHGEHSPCYSPDVANHYLTDGKEKFVWYPKSMEEQFFDLTKNRLEREDLSKRKSHKKRVDLWRKRLIDILAKRDDGFSDGKKLLQKSHWSPLVENNRVQK
ncbi:MAG: arylsulfatase [Planctomycetes bacterium]|nr:arylsulfatase [Planctomycetota bacterium]